MLGQLISSVTNIIISIISSTGYLGVFGLMTAESALIPIPSEVTMPFAGYLASIGRFNIFFVIIVGASANLFGSILAYWLGFWGGEAVVRKLIKDYGKYLLMSESEYDKSELWFRKYGQRITFFSRVLPIVRTFISLPAGVSRMNFWKFAFFTFFGSLIWSGLLAYVGFILGKNWNAIHGYYQKFEFVIIGAIIIAVVYYILHKLQKLHRK